ncbi:methionine/alanine import family NSS transporter small subunit [Shewanella gelidii]|nr:methionine/alanine import family NSS transporter small subunit [Shewanella gelidii]MCL1097087.1 methionine/alanine import family NSS transporter small subunit [Shewanella gelidii]
MTTSAIIMMLFGLGITWGGAAVCISIAMNQHHKDKQ